MQNKQNKKNSNNFLENFAKFSGNFVKCYYFYNSSILFILSISQNKKKIQFSSFVKFVKSGFAAILATATRPRRGGDCTLQEFSVNYDSLLLSLSNVYAGRKLQPL